jgi:hypothetical protein
MTEVKAASAVKDSFYQDCAIQAWVAEGAGPPVRKVTLGRTESRFVYAGGGDYGGLLQCIDVTTEVRRGLAPQDDIFGPLADIADRRRFVGPVRDLHQTVASVDCGCRGC